jgi:hypothetical protein
VWGIYPLDGWLRRSLLTQEGICLQLQPNFHFLEVAYPYVARRLLTDEDPALRERLFQVSDSCIYSEVYGFAKPYTLNECNGAGPVSPWHASADAAEQINELM